MNSLAGDSSPVKEFQMANGKEQMANGKRFEFCHLKSLARHLSLITHHCFSTFSYQQRANASIAGAES
jgi:hypothetical protein